ncbi:hypothetical protein [Paracoccus methylarcula]|uniref:hypothetical protein n=1 Tax=Paracoccus methylarcula TaxID=72022 RepID=UPI0011CE6BA6|nr:hypothetical protein [Paracoccus methylarcula]
MIACDYLRHSGNIWKPNEGQALKKLTAQKWANIKGKLHCPSCDARRRAEAAARKVEEQDMQETAAPEMSGKQKRLIVLALEDAWGDGASRYRDAYTDKAVAAELGDGIRAGWVRQVREEMFGPDGGNEEIEDIRAEIEALGRSFEVGLAEHRALYDGKIAALQKRIDGICDAVGPRAGKVPA